MSSGSAFPASETSTIPTGSIISPFIDVETMVIQIQSSALGAQRSPILVCKNLRISSLWLSGSPKFAFSIVPPFLAQIYLISITTAKLECQ